MNVNNLRNFMRVEQKSINHKNILSPGAFLIPYTICVIFGAVPMFMLEVAMGQWTSQGAISCWNHFCPILKGKIFP